MHELSLSSAIVEAVVEHAEGRPVVAVNMRVGRLRQVVPDSLEFYFDLVSRDTVCERASLRQEMVGARLRCASCEREWDVELPAFVCPRCGPGAVDVAGGDEFEIESIEIEEKEEAACTAPR